MNQKYINLFQTIKLGNGVELKNRFAMSPMVVFGTKEDDRVSQEDLDYFRLRNDTGNLIITGAAAVSKTGHGIPGQLTVFSDDNIEGLKQLASIMKEKGNKAILQLHHAGREAKIAYQRYGEAFAPTAMGFPFLDYKPKELTYDDIMDIINDFREATKRAMAAGFDGVEIHGANHYLLQQFFSTYSNQREEVWGGTLEKRMAFPLAVLKNVKEVAKKDFIVGYRLSPEEVHEDTVGYTVDDTVHLIEQLIQDGVDYIHLSTNDYKAMPQAGGNNEPIALTCYKAINHRVPMLLAGGISSPDIALDALNYCDIVALGRANICDPNFVSKIKEDKEEEIEYSVADRLNQLALPKKLVQVWTTKEMPLPPLKGF